MDDNKCKMGCWIGAAVAAVLAALIVNSLFSAGWIISLIVGLIVLFLGVRFLSAMFCKIPAEGPMISAPTAPQPAAPQPAAPQPVAQPEPAPVAAPAASATPAAGNWTDSVVAASGKAGASRGATGLKPSVELAEEATLRDGVGAWKYESGATAYRATAAAAGASAAPLEGDYDGDGVVEGADEGEKPATLTEAREGGADDLKQIKGVGPKMETMLNGMGFYHFDQVAAWTDQEVAWVDANLEGFKGRVSRDNWVEQAKILAAGGQTEFSKKVGDGGVY